jgi:hypothetical protein
MMNIPQRYPIRIWKFRHLIEIGSEVVLGYPNLICNMICC